MIQMHPCPANCRKPETKHTKTQRWNPATRIQTQIADDVQSQSSQTNLDGEWEETDTIYMRGERQSLLYKNLIFKLNKKSITFQIPKFNDSDALLSTHKHIHFRPHLQFRPPNAASQTIYQLGEKTWWRMTGKRTDPLLVETRTRGRVGREKLMEKTQNIGEAPLIERSR